MTKTGRNQPCPCGSGRKFKQCCADQATVPGAKSSALRVPLGVQPAITSPARRPCGGCTACCTTLIINDANLVVPSRTVCPHACAAGCAIHGPRQPKTCRSYHCDYRMSAAPRNAADRPDHVGAIVDRKRNPEKAPPMDRTTHVVACAPDGLTRVLDNATWRRMIQRDLLAGIPILAAQYDDPRNREVLGLRLQNERLYCRLTSCHPDGSPILIPLEPVNDPPVHIALLIPEQGFVFDTASLIDVLGKRSHLVINASPQASADQELRFLFTQQQAQWAQMLAKLAQVSLITSRGVSVTCS